MIYQTTVTQKGQITIPKNLREYLGVKRGAKITLEPEKNKPVIKLKSAPDLLDLAGDSGLFRPKKIINAVKIRGLMEKQYERF